MKLIQQDFPTVLSLITSTLCLGSLVYMKRQSIPWLAIVHGSPPPFRSLFRKDKDMLSIHTQYI